jgi:hypothetical protein
MNPSKRKQLYRISLAVEKAKSVVQEEKKEEVKKVEPVVVPEPVVEAAVETVPEVVADLQPELIVAEEVVEIPAPTGKKKKSV